MRSAAGYWMIVRLKLLWIKKKKNKKSIKYKSWSIQNIKLKEYNIILFFEMKIWCFTFNYLLDSLKYTALPFNFHRNLFVVDAIHNIKNLIEFKLDILIFLIHVNHYHVKWLSSNDWLYRTLCYIALLLNESIACGF